MLAFKLTKELNLQRAETGQCHCHGPQQQWNFEAARKVADVVYDFSPELVPVKLVLASKLARELNLQRAGTGQCRRHGPQQQWNFEAAQKVADVVYDFSPELVPAKLILASKLTRELNLQRLGMCQQRFGHRCQQQLDLKNVWNV